MYYAHKSKSIEDLISVLKSLYHTLALFLDGKWAYLVHRQSKARKENNFSVSRLTVPYVFLFDYLGNGVIFFA